ncbi:hypothetical protein EUX98_g7811 [Antrodiella citrinella]|uniref:O-methyltransferase C-terminal domain-containing protein n=1 Tax=Antrodiella citrinella TaxID=2447956 RepID=A0A4S4MMH2_9APHY|nr:hypothetical protein EUX98_g7811 [Antrodiella citrinella]
MEDLRSLAKFVNDSIQQIGDSYSRRGMTFPFLEEPFAAGNANACYDDPVVKQAAANAIAAAAQIAAIVRPPSDTIILTSHQDLHVEEIARLAFISANRLSRILRLLASEHIFAEVEPDVFANNRISSVIDTEKTLEEIPANPEGKYVGTSGIATVVDHIVHHGQKSSAYLTETLLGPKTAFSEQPTDAPLNRAFRTDLTVWEWLELPENKHDLRFFSMAMRGNSKILPADAILNGHDFSALTAGSVVVDVAGGVGSQTVLLARAHPNLRYIVQDRAAMSGEMQQNVSVFFMRMILHDWPDDKCIVILKNLRGAAQPTTKLLILEFLLSFAVPTTASGIQDDDTPKPPAPLLLNAGHAGLLPHLYDMTMMVGMNGARERTLEQFGALFDASGWKIERVYRAPYFVNAHSQIVLVPV